MVIARMGTPVLVVLAVCFAASTSQAQIKPRIADASMMKEIGLCWNLYYTMTGKAPAKASDLNDYLEGAKTKKALEDGDIVMVPNAKQAAASVIAYEKEPDKKGVRFVTFGDGSVKSLDEAEFKKALGGK